MLLQKFSDIRVLVLFSETTLGKVTGPLMVGLAFRLQQSFNDKNKKKRKKCVQCENFDNLSIHCTTKAVLEATTFQTLLVLLFST